jgi:cell division transport system permease protein
LLKFGCIVTLIFSGLRSLALVAITFNTIRLQILTQSSEIEVSKLIGAIQGLLGGILTKFVITFSMLLLNYRFKALSQIYTCQLISHPLSFGDSISLLLFSMIFSVGEFVS